jgi:hypothetical protein
MNPEIIKGPAGDLVVPADLEVLDTAGFLLRGMKLTASCSSSWDGHPSSRHKLLSSGSRLPSTRSSSSSAD